MPGRVKVNGAWESVASAFAKVNNAWKDVAEAYTKVNGQWKQWFKSGFPVIAVAHSGDPYISTYPWSPGFGAKFANPATSLQATGNDVSFSPSGTDIAVAYSDDPYISTYPWSPGFGSKFADPATSVQGPGGGVAFTQ